MSRKILFKARFWLYLCLFLLIPLFAYGEKSTRTYRKFTLKNGIKVLLVCDPDVNNSAASMDILVGSLSDPAERQGLAHFLEHMLFLATKKYPTLNEYGEYLKANGGYSNAFTAPDQTNYHFQVNHSGFPEALDRFAQFFISPLLDYKYAEREVAAVNSEHQKNIPQDTWRILQIRRSLYANGHPARGFHTGSIKTLQGTKEEELRKFLSKYSSNKMALCMISSIDLDKQEELARKIFSEIPERPSDTPQVSSKLLEEKNTARVVKIVPIRETRQIQIFFPLPPQYQHLGSKSGRLIGMTMGDEGAGSLLSFLKKQGLATSLSAGVGDETRFYSNCQITIGLTQKGLENYKEVIQHCFAYIELLKKSPFPDHIWKEMKTMSELQERYSPKAEGSDAAIALSHNANLYGLDIAEKVESHFTQPDEKNYREILSFFRPSNMVVFLIAKGFKTDQTEAWYGTSYSMEEDGKLFESLKAVTIPKEIHLPLPNPFIPKNMEILSERPVLILKNRKITLWFSQDTEFKRPKVAIYVHIVSPASYSSAKNVALLEIYTALIKERLNEFAYPAIMAGLSYNLSGSKKGLLLSVQGYSDSALSLLQILGKELLNNRFTETDFLSIKERMIRGIQNMPFSQPYMLSREHSRKINVKKYFSPEDILKEVQTLNLKDVQDFIPAFYKQVHLQSLAHGNLEANQIREAVQDLSSNLGGQAFSPEKSHEDAVLWLKPGSDETYKETMATNNSCLRMEYQVGMADLKTQATTWIFDHAIRNGFYTEMRTKQMLGYIVFSGSYARENVENLVFLVQSGTHPARDLLKRADAYLSTLSEKFEKMPDAYFEAIRRSLIEERMQKPKSIEEKAAMFYALAFEKDGDFDYLQKEIQALKEVKKEEVVALLQRTLDPKTRARISILLNAKNHPKDEIPATIQEIAKFHEHKVFDEFPRITRRMLLGE